MFENYTVYETMMFPVNPWVMPVVGVVDGGKLYDPLVDELMSKNMPVFRSSDSAVRALALYLEGRLTAERLRRRNR